MEITTIVTALLPLLTLVLPWILQYYGAKKERAKAEAEIKKLDVDSLSQLAETAMKLNRYEVDSLREMCKEYKETNEYLNTQVDLYQGQIQEKDKEIVSLKEQLNILLQKQSVTIINYPTVTEPQINSDQVTSTPTSGVLYVI